MKWREGYQSTASYTGTAHNEGQERYWGEEPNIDVVRPNSSFHKQASDTDIQQHTKYKEFQSPDKGLVNSESEGQAK